MNDNSDTTLMLALKLGAVLVGCLVLFALLTIWDGHSREQEFNAAPPQEETWQATIHANTWDAAIAIDAPCAVRLRSAMHCRYPCSLRSITVVECGGRTLIRARDTDTVIFMSERKEGVDDWRLEGGARMVWDHAAGTLILESTAALEPRRLALKLAPTSTVEVDPHCRATLRDAIGIDATPPCGYAYLDPAM